MNLDTFLNEVIKVVKKDMVHVKLFIPYERGDLINLCETKGEIIDKSYNDKGASFELNIHNKFYARLREFDLDLS